MFKICMALICLVFSVSAHSALLVTVGGELKGATGVTVDGIVYDVDFLDGTCVDLFDGCDELSDLDFNNAATAVLAAQALMNQVFLDGLAGNFDSDPASIFGCDSPVGCVAYVPYAITTYFGGPGVNTKFANNFADEAKDGAGGNNVNNALTDYPGSSGMYAKFTVSSVPVPATAWLFGLGLLGLIGVARRTK